MIFRQNNDDVLLSFTTLYSKVFNDNAKNEKLQHSSIIFYIPGILKYGSNIKE